MHVYIYKPARQVRVHVLDIVKFSITSCTFTLDSCLTCLNISCKIIAHLLCKNK